MPPRKKAEPEPEVKAPETDEEVEVEFGDDPGETATLLLAAAEELHGDQSLVRTGTGVFYVPKSVADKAKK
jgi:hypothetical protein